MDGMMIVLRSAETLPFLSAAKIAHQPSVEVGDSSPGMPKRVFAEVPPEVEIDPLEVSTRPSCRALTSTAPISVMSPTEGAPTPKGASRSTTIGVPTGTDRGNAEGWTAAILAAHATADRGARRASAPAEQRGVLPGRSHAVHAADRANRMINKNGD